MCGIVGYVGPRDAAQVILEGLRRLEYRGYDSAGLAVLQDDHIQIRRQVGKLSALAKLLAEAPLSGNVGIGHTRWATHGAPSRNNAHPHRGPAGEVVVVHNGIVENFLELRRELSGAGAVFASDTDTEVIAHLVERLLAEGQSLEEAVRGALMQLKGAHGIVVMSSREPDKLIGARIGNAGGVTVGVGEGEMFLASDMPAILEYTRRVVFLESRQMAVVKRDGWRVSTLSGEPAAPAVHVVPYDPVAAEKGEYKHFMQKEIHEQARAITDTLRGRVDFENGRLELPELNLTPAEAQALERIVVVACGTSYHAALVGRAYFENLARIPTQAEIGSEFRYAEPLIEGQTAVLALTQSGETVDTLAAMEEARHKGARLWSIVNVAGSQAQRLADGCILMQAGPEIGVASTKAFTVSLVDEYLLALYLAQLRDSLPAARRCELVNDLARLPDLVGRALDYEAEAKALAEQLFEARHALYLGRGLQMPIALEGALKLKEISYIHAEGYAAGEMKHGPIALIDREMPVVAVCLRDRLYTKMLAQVEQAKARGGRVIVVATDGDERAAAKADYVLHVPEAPELLAPVLAVIPLQLLAYHVAVRRGADVDQPRNLAKSVTVE